MGEERIEGKGGKELGCRQRVAAAEAINPEPICAGELNGVKFCVTLVDPVVGDVGWSDVGYEYDEKEPMWEDGMIIRLSRNARKEAGLATLFHELGHIMHPRMPLPSSVTIWSGELLAWKEALRYAKHFPEISEEEMKERAVKCLTGYLCGGLSFVAWSDSPRSAIPPEWLDGGGSPTLPFIEGARDVLGDEIADRLYENVRSFEERWMRCNDLPTEERDRARQLLGKEMLDKARELEHELKSLAQAKEGEGLTGEDVRSALKRIVNLPPEPDSRRRGASLLGGAGRPELERYRRAEEAANIRSDLNIAYGLEGAEGSPRWLVALNGEKCKPINGRGFPTTYHGRPLERPTYEVRFTDDDVLAMVNVHALALSMESPAKLRDFRVALAESAAEVLAVRRSGDVFVMSRPTVSALYYSTEAKEHAHFMPGPPREKVQAQLLSKHSSREVEAFFKGSVATLMPKELELFALIHSRVIQNPSFIGRLYLLFSAWEGGGAQGGGVDGKGGRS